MMAEMAVSFGSRWFAGTCVQAIVEAILDSFATAFAGCVFQKTFR
jgi:hypothetical protein